jgi:hypothetical protein
MSAAADPLGALRTILLADADVAAASGGNVYCIEIRREDVKAMPRAAVLLKPAGGPGARGYQQFGKLRVTVACYGETGDESWTLWLTVKPVLQQLARVTSQHALIHSATMEADGAFGIDPTTQWPTTFSSWLVLASDIATP